MYQELIKTKLQKDLDIELKHVENVINFLNEGCTIPFIARYRKEWTGSMSDEKLRVFHEKYTYYNMDLDEEYADFREKPDKLIEFIKEKKPKQFVNYLPRLIIYIVFILIGIISLISVPTLTSLSKIIIPE